jgi:hypothetical protein
VPTKTDLASIGSSVEESLLEPSAASDASEAGEFEPSDYEPSNFDSSSVQSSSTSVSSSVYLHSYQSGRRYHKASGPPCSR